MKLVLGTANFDLSYGFKKKKIEKKTIFSIKKISKKQIIYFDTAIGYGNSHKILGKYFKKKKVITKFVTPLKNGKIDYKSLNLLLTKTLKDLKIKKLHSLLFHNVEDLMKNRKSLEIIQKFKKKGLVDNIGVSVYSPDEIKKILIFWKPDIIQFPINIFDQRMLKKNLLSKLKKKKIVLMARSCFLQGILLKSNPFFKERYFKNKHKKFVNWCANNKVSQLSACLIFIKSIKELDLLTFGFDNEIQLREILNNFKKKNFKKIKFSRFSLANKTRIIDPRLWKKN